MGIFDSLLGKDSSAASNAAAQDTYAKQKAAGNQLRKAGDAYNTGMQSLSQSFNPYVSAGADALGMLKNGLGLGGAGGSQAFTQAYQALPGYTEGLQTGQDSAVAGLNASGRLNSGGALKALQRYGSDYENMRSGDYLTRLMGLQGQGLQATGQQVATAGQGLQGQLGTRQTAYGGDMQAAGTIGQGMVAGAQAEQQGIGNVLNAATYLGGAALGGPAGTSLAGFLKPKPAAPSLGGGIWAGL